MPLPAPVWFVAAFIPMVASQVLRLHHREGFRVPLVERAVEIVQRMRQGQVSGCVFPGQAHGKPLSNMALLVLLKRMNTGERKWLDPVRGRPITAHCFRASFRTWAEEVATFPHAVVEQATGHRVGTQVERALPPYGRPRQAPGVDGGLGAVVRAECGSTGLLEPFGNRTVAGELSRGEDPISP
jgi:hypothetical protein